MENLVQSMLAPSGGIGLRRLINGTFMKWSFLSTGLSAGANSGFGARSTALVTFLIFWLDILGQSRRNTRAAKRFFRKLFKQHGRPWVVITDKLGSYSAALKSLAPSIDHRRHKGGGGQKLVFVIVWFEQGNQWVCYRKILEERGLSRIGFCFLGIPCHLKNMTPSAWRLVFHLLRQISSALRDLKNVSTMELS